MLPQRRFLSSTYCTRELETCITDNLRLGLHTQGLVAPLAKVTGRASSDKIIISLVQTRHDTLMI